MAEANFSISTRLKREEFNRTKHDSVFSKWEILIGPSDWENHLLGKEGTDRYRIHNLPVSSSCPGMYELGIALSHTDAGRKVRNLDPDRIVTVYLGQADNVRTRLQHYGRVGSHLDHGNSVGIGGLGENKSSCRGPGLFREIFARGYPIVFRWVPMDNKREAEKAEGQLLRIFDYAWNKGGNGVRRPNDILLKLDKISSSSSTFPNIARKLQQYKWNHPFGQKQVGIRVKASMPLSTETKSSACDQKSHNLDLGFRILKFGRSQPRSVSGRFGANEDNTTTCGVALGDGSVCRRRPNEGRKRCEEHKGKRVNGCITTSMTEGQSNMCGVSLEDGSFCTEDPVHGRKRCELHKGRRVTTLPIIPMSKFGRLQPQLVSDSFGFNEDNSTICGMVLSNGSVCRRRPNEGRKRCEEHKGKRITESTIRLVTDEESLVCGAGLKNGSVCMKVPAHGRKRCELHKGRRAAY